MAGPRRLELRSAVLETAILPIELWTRFPPTCSLRGYNSMAISTPNLALRDLLLDGIYRMSVMNHYNNVHFLLASHMIEIKCRKTSFPAIDTGMRIEIVPQEFDKNLSLRISPPSRFRNVLLTISAIMLFAIICVTRSTFGLTRSSGFNLPSECIV